MDLVKYLNFVFNEGTLCGFKTDILKFINFEIPIPLIINGYKFS